MPPVALLLGSVATGGTAVALEAAEPAPEGPVGGPALVTPVVSARRMPTVVAEPIAARRLSADLAGWVASQPPDTCLVVTGDDDLRIDHQGELPLVPASGAKLLTATATLLELGGDLRFRTTLLAAAPPAGAVVPGDLVLVGGGDPVLATAEYAALHPRQPQTFTDLDGLAEAVQAAGVTRVEGSVVGDEGRYDRQRYVDSWPQRYIDQDQIGPLSALSVNDGFAEYPLTPDDPQDRVPAGDPAADAAEVLTRLLEAREIEVVGAPRAGGAPEGAVELAALESAPVAELVAQMLRESDNNAAELLLKELGRAAGDPSTAGGREVARRALGEAGLDVEQLSIADGSGLSPDNRASCEVLVDLITGEAPASDLQDGLAVAGRTGTLAGRFVGTPLEGTLRGKTGSLNSVTSLTGVVEDRDGPLAFSVVVNVPDGQITAEIVAAQQELGEVLLSWPRVPDVAALGPAPPTPQPPPNL